MARLEIKRHRLNVQAHDLNIAAAAIDSALNITPAKAAATTGCRKHALAMLQGTNVIADTVEGKRGSVVQKRTISLDTSRTAEFCTYHGHQGSAHVTDIRALRMPWALEFCTCQGR